MGGREEETRVEGEILRKLKRVKRSPGIDKERKTEKAYDAGREVVVCVEADAQSAIAKKSAALGKKR